MLRTAYIQTARLQERLKALFSLKGSDAAAITVESAVRPVVVLEDPTAPEMRFTGGVRPIWGRIVLGAGGAGVYNFAQLWNPTLKTIVVVERAIVSVAANATVTMGPSDAAYTYSSQASVRDTRIAPPNVVWAATAGVVSELRTRANAVSLNYTPSWITYLLANTAYECPVNAVIGPNKGFVIEIATANLAAVFGFIGYERELEPAEPQ